MNDLMDTANMKGMPQVNTFTSLTPRQMADLTPKRMDKVSGARRGKTRTGWASRQIPRGSWSSGMGRASSRLPAQHIMQAAMDLVRESPPWVRTSAITGRSTEMLFNIETCMECCAPSLVFSCPRILKAEMLRGDIFRLLMVGPAGNSSWGLFA
ncbi:hypothetical protein B0H13DRAFT_1919310 [Mycena leptocephala]|nr:hypothetical protein B0H13DRAFT_1919310 [Mycena leptocephala]